jgi:hypothetical protein
VIAQQRESLVHVQAEPLGEPALGLLDDDTAVQRRLELLGEGLGAAHVPFLQQADRGNVRQRLPDPQAGRAKPVGASAEQAGRAADVSWAAVPARVVQPQPLGDDVTGDVCRPPVMCISVSPQPGKCLSDTDSSAPMAWQSMKSRASRSMISGRPSAASAATAPATLSASVMSSSPRSTTAV